MSYQEQMARSVVRYDESDKAALRAFQRAHFGERARQADDAFYEWLFERNPHRGPEGPSLWVCKRDGVVVGQQGGIPFRLKVDDAEYRAAWVIDLMVDPAWRLRGVAPVLFDAFRASVDIAVGLGVEDPVYRAFVRAGWKDIDTMTLYVRPLDFRACADALQRGKTLGRMVPTSLLTGTARIAAGLARTWARVALEPIAQFDSEVDGVWRAASPDYRMLSRRDHASLRWRFDEGPHRVLYRRYYVRHAGGVVGYAVVRLERWYGHVAARIVDYLAPRRYVEPLLALVIDAMRPEAAAVFLEHVDARERGVLDTLGWLRVRRSWRFMFHARPEQTALAATLARADGWFVTPGDSDFEHIWIANRDAGEAPAPHPISAASRAG